jgi:hypothetical protein
MTASIFTAEGKHHPFPGVPLTAAERIVFGHWPGIANGGGFPSGLDESRVAHAEVNHGRWTVRCPWCSGCQNASEEDHRFFCTECSNGAAGGKWIAVVWPADREEIELALGQRPHPDNRNWLPGETIADLWLENAAHGVV